MAKGKYQQWLEPDGLTLLKGWARDGLTQAEMSARMGITRSTFNAWLLKYPDISDTIKKTREVYDSEVVDAIHKNTQGFKVTLKKAMKCRRVEYDEKGRRTAEIEEMVPYEEEMYVSPNPMSQIYWMNNRDPAHWRGNKDAQERNRIELERLKMEQAAAEAEEKNAAAGWHVTFSVTHGDEPAVDEVMG